jgi:hypothetical protein
MTYDNPKLHAMKTSSHDDDDDDDGDDDVVRSE